VEPLWPCLPAKSCAVVGAKGLRERREALSEVTAEYLGGLRGLCFAASRGELWPLVRCGGSPALPNGRFGACAISSAMRLARFGSCAGVRTPGGSLACPRGSVQDTEGLVRSWRPDTLLMDSAT